MELHHGLLMLLSSRLREMLETLLSSVWSGGNESMTIRIISIIIIIIAGNIFIIISIVIVMMVCCGDRRESAGMTSGGHNLMGWW